MANPAGSDSAVPLSLEAYVSDFTLGQNMQDLSTLKLESAQSFVEPENASWMLFNSGDWEGALAIASRSKDEIDAYFADLASRNIKTRRVRVVDETITPYLWWESQVLKMRCDAGEQIRVVATEQASSEFGSELAELLFLGEDVLYEIRYSEEGAILGALKHSDLQKIAAMRDSVERLFSAGQDFAEWFDSRLPVTPPVLPS